MAFTTTALIAAGALAVAAAGATTSIVAAASNKDKGSGPEPMKMPDAPKIEDAAGNAGDKMKKRRMALAGSKSVFTNPLGSAGEANVMRKSLLGQ